MFNYVMYTADGSDVHNKCVHIIFLHKIFTCIETGVHTQFTYVCVCVCVYVCGCGCVQNVECVVSQIIILIFIMT